jgi:polysaccharide export outer membrane protein
VLPDGTFAFPLVGQVVAAGQLPADLERIIRAALQPQYRGVVPQVTVSVTNPSGYTFSVIGKVKGPGTFTPGRYVNALEALTIAGGPSEFASLGNAVILRKNGQQIQTIRIRLSDAIRGDARRLTESDVPFIQSGDTLVVP